MFLRRTRCHFFRKDRLWKKYDIVFVVRVENRHHHFINLFSECFENESMQSYSETECKCQIMHFKWRHYHQNIIERDQNENVHILTSSKFALFNVSFKKVLQTFDFCDRVCLVVIDETHLMKDWFSWRFKYDRFCELRSILSRIIFLFITLIIFEDELIAKLIKKLRFSENLKFIHESMNREKIFFNV